ncbi:MAG: hypothetical protein ACRDMJ_20185 [Solirubrobacteraceae bacterium]
MKVAAALAPIGLRLSEEKKRVQHGLCSPSRISVAVVAIAACEVEVIPAEPVDELAGCASGSRG